MGLSFVTSVKIANLMGKEMFGQLAYSIALGTYGAVIVRFGMDRTLVRELIHYPKQFGKLLAGSLVLRGFLFTLVSVGLLLWKTSLQQTSALSWGVIIIIISICLGALDLQSVYDTWQKMQRHAIYHLIHKCLYFAIIWVIVIFSPKNLSPFWVGLAMLSSCFVYLAMQYQWALKRIAFDNIRNSFLEVVLSMLRKNLLIWPAAFVGLSFGMLNQLMLKHLCGAGELGGYAAAWQVVSIAAILLSQISRIGNPAMGRITREGTNRIRRIQVLAKYFAAMLLISSLVGIPAIIFPDLILRKVFRPEYADAAGIMRIMGVYTIVFSVGLVSAQYIVSARMEKVYLISISLGGCLSIIFCLVLIPKLAGLGAALSLLFSHGTSIGLYCIAMIYNVQSQKQ